MPLGITGMIGGNPGADGATVSIAGAPEIDPAYIQRFARIHEEGGFDRVLIGYGSSGPDGWSLATWAAAATGRLHFLVAHRPGFVAPTLAARKAATIDQLSGGRIALHIITGGADAEMQKDGDWHDKETRYRRTAEYVDVLKRTWTSTEPFDYEGEFYRFKAAFSAVRPVQQPHPLVFLGGNSPGAYEAGARFADVWATFGEPLEPLKQQIAMINAKAAEWDRSVGIHISLRVILGATEEKAWERARSILADLERQRGGAPRRSAPSVTAQRLVGFAAEQEVYDKRLWTAIAAETGAGSNSMTLVGTPDQVAESLVDYWEAGVSNILIRGFDPYNDTIAYGRDLIPVVRQEVARRERTPATV